MKKFQYIISQLAKTALFLVLSLFVFSSFTLEKQSFIGGCIKTNFSQEKKINNTFFIENQNQNDEKTDFFKENEKEAEEDDEKDEKDESFGIKNQTKYRSFSFLEKTSTAITQKVSAPDADFYTFNKPPFFIFYLQLKRFLA